MYKHTAHIWRFSSFLELFFGEIFCFETFLALRISLVSGSNFLITKNYKTCKSIGL